MPDTLRTGGRSPADTYGRALKLVAEGLSQRGHYDGEFSGFDVVPKGSQIAAAAKPFLKANVTAGKPHSGASYIKITDLELTEVDLRREDVKGYPIIFERCRLEDLSASELSLELLNCGGTANGGNESPTRVDLLGGSLKIECDEGVVSVSAVFTLELKGLPDGSFPSLTLNGTAYSVNILSGSEIDSILFDGSAINLESDAQSISQAVFWGSTDLTCSFEGGLPSSITGGKLVGCSINLESDSDASIDFMLSEVSGGEIIANNCAFSEFRIDRITDGLSLNLSACFTDRFILDPSDLKGLAKLQLEKTDFNFMPDVPRISGAWPRVGKIKHAAREGWHRSFEILHKCAAKNDAYDLAAMFKHKSQQFRLKSFELLSHWQTGFPLFLYGMLSGFGRSLWRPVFWYFVCAGLAYTAYLGLSGVEGLIIGGVPAQIDDYTLLFAGAFPLLIQPPKDLTGMELTILAVHSLLSTLFLFLLSLAIRGRVKL